ncbi:MAG: hypothetical protein CMI26_08375 [Opitutae bacterium]|nr:hypothetical protein [Opitutae bacterium]
MSIYLSDLLDPPRHRLPFEAGVNTCIYCNDHIFGGGDETVYYQLNERKEGSAPVLLCKWCAAVKTKGMPMCPMSEPEVQLFKKLAHCEDGMYYCPLCNKDLNGLESAMEHVRATSYAHESQCMLAGPYVLKGIGEIEPYIELKACRMAMVRCKYCGESVRVGEWVSHVKESCTKLPCAFCLSTLVSAATCLGRQLFTIDQLHKGAMHFDDIFEPVSGGKEGNGCQSFQHGTWEQMKQHVSERTASHESGYRCLRHFVTYAKKVVENGAHCSSRLSRLSAGSPAGGCFVTGGGKSPRAAGSSAFVALTSKRVEDVKVKDDTAGVNGTEQRQTKRVKKA